MPEAQDIIAQIAVEVAKEISKDAYKDGLSPPVKQIGAITEDILKALHLVIAPVQLLAAVQDRYRDFLNRAVKRIPESQRIAPPIQILGPVLEGIKFEPAGSPLEEMFSELLSRSMDRERINEAHPAFPYLIRQLSSDEAEIMRLIVERKRGGEETFKRSLQHRIVENDMFKFEKVLEDQFPTNSLTFPENLDFYIHHLGTLGIANLFAHKNQTGVYHIEEDQIGNKLRVQTATIEYMEYRFTDFGLMLAEASIRQP